MEATLVVTDGTGDVVLEHREQVTPTESWPNGKECAPRCVSAPTIVVPGPSS